MLLPTWAVLGTSRPSTRALGLALGCALLIGVVWVKVWRQLSPYGIDLTADMAIQWGCVTLFNVLINALASVALWLAGLRLILVSGQASPRGSIWPRFTVRQLLILTAAAGILVALGKLIHSTVGEQNSYSWQQWWTQSLTAATNTALLTCIGIGAALSPAPPAARIALANAAAVVLAVTVAWCLQAPAELWPTVVFAGFVRGIWLTGSLLVVRACGYRALWPADWVWAAGLADELKA